MSSPPRFPASDHCDGQRFHNPRHHVNRSLADVLRWKRTSHPASWPTSVTLPIAPAGMHDRKGMSVTWVGHATCLIQIGEQNFLVDPVFSERAGPFGVFGPRRVHPPRPSLDDLPAIDAVLLSHDHYDHCDMQSLRKLSSRSSDTVLVTPLGNGELAARAGFQRARIHELDWWDEYKLEDLTIIATPARHWSNRLSGTRNGRLWSGFFLTHSFGKVFYSGDTGYDEVMFKEIGRRCGAPDLAMIPIGAYEPRWFMAAQHCNPEEAVIIHQDVRAKRSIGVHWGTFQLTDEARDAPIAALEIARHAAGVPAAQFSVVLPGQIVSV